MGEDLQFFQIPFTISKNLDTAYTLFLLVTRFGALFLLLPGLHGGMRGLAMKTPFFLAMGVACLKVTPPVAIPSDVALMVGAFLSEILLGLALGMIPLIIVSIAQNAGQLSSISMGLQTSAQIDPATGGQSADMARLYGDLCVLTFLSLNGHHVLVYAASGLSGKIVPGSFVLTESSLTMLIQRSSDIFGTGMLLAAPVIVALLLTQFVMGYISKLVPQVNSFIMSFPLTVGIGLILCMLSLPEIVRIFGDQFTTLERSATVLLNDTQMHE